jgi:hypothetical protein
MSSSNPHVMVAGQWSMLKLMSSMAMSPSLPDPARPSKMKVAALLLVAVALSWMWICA